MAKARQITGIDCEGAAAAGIRLVLTTRLQEVCELRESALDWSNPEGVHDMRVASRRLRSALRDFMPYLSRRQLSGSLHEIKNVADALGQVRDHDVAILALEKLAHKAPRLVVSGVEGFANIRRQNREEARAALMRALDQNTVAELRSTFANTLDLALDPQGSKKSKPASRNPMLITYRKLARTTILDRLVDLEKLSDSLYRPMNVKPLHDMRLAAKRLRYAIELFDNCWERQTTTFAKRLALLQTSLGDLHDCDVWIDSFGDDLSPAESDTETERVQTVLSDHKAASVWLLCHFLRLRTKYFRDAVARWLEWQTSDFSDRLRKTLLAESSGFRESPNAPAEDEAVSPAGRSQLLNREL